MQTTSNVHQLPPIRRINIDLFNEDDLDQHVLYDQSGKALPQIALEYEGSDGTIITLNFGEAHIPPNINTEFTLVHLLYEILPRRVLPPLTRRVADNVLTLMLGKERESNRAKRELRKHLAAAQAKARQDEAVRAMLLRRKNNPTPEEAEHDRRVGTSWVDNALFAFSPEGAAFEEKRRLDYEAALRLLDSQQPVFREWRDDPASATSH